MARNRRRTRSAAVLFAALSLGASAARAGDRHEGAIWIVNQAAAPVSEKISLHLMVQNRWTEDVGPYQRTMVRPWVTVGLPAGFRFATGYDAHAFESPTEFVEQRAWQRIEWSHPLGPVRLLTHFWLEERFFPGNSVAWRGRFQVGGAVDLPADVQLVVRNDMMFDLNTTDRIRSTGLGENQLFATFSRRLLDGVRLDAGYLMQYLDSPGSDLYNHSFTIGLAFETPALRELLHPTP